MLGSDADPLVQRFWNWFRFGHKRIFIHQLRSWLFLNRNYGNGRLPELDENLAVGWFPQEAPKDPLVDSNAFVVHALGANNGELWVQSAGKNQSVISGLQNIPIYYLVILREQGAAYYVASLPGAIGMAGYPEMRPLAIDGANQETSLYAGIQQSVLGQIGFRVDTRVYSTQVRKIEEYDQWYGAAHAADRLFGTGLLNDSDAETGQPWRVPAGRFVRNSNGVRGLDAWNLAYLNPGEPSGLIHLILDELPEEKQLQVYWRYLDNDNYWCLSLSRHGFQLNVKESGSLEQIAERIVINPGEHHYSAIQILDNGKQIELFLNGKRLFESGCTDERLADAVGVGFGCQASINELKLHHFEAHPRSLPIPDEFLQKAPWLPSETQVVLEDHFEGPQSDLQGREIPQIKEVWQRTMGNGIMQVNGNGSLQVLATAEQPNPDRTAYSFVWQDLNYADLDVEITPPGTARGEWEKGRGGFIFWQCRDS